MDGKQHPFLDEILHDLVSAWTYFEVFAQLEHSYLASSARELSKGWVEWGLKPGIKAFSAINV